MSLIGHLFTSSIGRKFLMAVSGLILVGFVIGHLVGNLQVFGAPDQINGYAHFLHSLGPVLWAARLGLLVAVGVHIWAAVVLTLESRKARGAKDYGVKGYIQASVASRYMRLTGLVVLAFIVYHIAHFTLGSTNSENYKGNLPRVTLAEDVREFGFPLAAKGTEVEDVYSMIFLSFANPWISSFYIVAVGLLSFHLLHGFDSMFQTMGLRNYRWSGALRGFTALFCLAYFIGNLAIPGAILLGLNKPQAGTYAATIGATASAASASACTSCAH
jgi:succinate dehydrogenase / fumarate reductase cytochrome b subunit